MDLSSLSTPQLSQVKKQLDDELEHLSSSFTQLRNAQAKFRECVKSIEGGVSSKTAGMLKLLSYKQPYYTDPMMFNLLNLSNTYIQPILQKPNKQNLQIHLS